MIFFKQINAKTIEILWVQVRCNFGFILDPLPDVQLLIRRKRCRSYAYIHFCKLLEVPGIPSHPGRLASSIVGRQQQGPLGDAYSQWHVFSWICHGLFFVRTGHIHACSMSQVILHRSVPTTSVGNKKRGTERHCWRVDFLLYQFLERFLPIPRNWLKYERLDPLLVFERGYAG